jgi:hypothetical protein
VRTKMRRYTRLSNRFSRKLENHSAAVALNYSAYNFIKIHRTLGTSPAMAAGVTDRLWSVEDLVALWEAYEQREGGKSGVVLADSHMSKERDQQLSNDSWDLSQERAFIENLFCQRFNFFIVIFSLVVAGAAAANTQPKLIIILWIGFVLCILLSLAIYRIYVKLIEILRSLHSIEGHPVAQSGVAVKDLGFRGLFGVNAIIGIIIPVICCLALFIGGLFSSIGMLAAK